MGRPVQVKVTFTKTFSQAPVTGRLVLLMDTNLFGAEPRESGGPENLFNLQPFCSVTVKDWKPDTPVVVYDRATCFQPNANVFFDPSGRARTQGSPVDSSC